MYSYGYSAVSSAIPAYAKVGDTIFAYVIFLHFANSPFLKPSNAPFTRSDESVNFSIQQGIIASRSTVHYFKHNDVQDLARLLKEHAREEEKNPKLARTRSRFILVEGLYINHGDICPLPEIVSQVGVCVCVCLPFPS